MTRTFQTACLFLVVLLSGTVQAFGKTVSISFHEALRKGFVRMQDATGLGGHTGPCINLSLQNCRHDDLDLYIAPATVFKPADDKVQPLYAVGDLHLRLKADSCGEVTLNAFCGNIAAHSPEFGSRYYYWKQGDANMVAVMQTIKELGCYRHAGQVAVWSLTNNYPVHAIYDPSQISRSRTLASMVARLRHLPEPEYSITGITIRNSDGNGPMEVPDYSHAFVNLNWELRSARNPKVFIYREDGSLYRVATDTERIYTGGRHSMTLRFDTATTPEGVYYVCLKDHENAVLDRRRVVLGPPREQQSSSAPANL